MKLWIAAAAVIAAAFVAFMIAVASESTDSDGSPTPTQTSSPRSATPTPSAAVFCGEKTCVPTAPTPTAPASCGFGSGIWEECEKTATEPAEADFSSRYRVLPNSLAVSAVYVAWPDSCLGVETPGVLCAQVITPGYQVILQAADTPFAEYHTDLNGRAVFVRTYSSYKDIPVLPPTSP